MASAYREAVESKVHGAKTPSRMSGARLAWWLVLAMAVTLAAGAPGADPAVGRRLPPWQPGNLDIHQINTGRGDAALFILPDGTTLLLDAGANAPRSGVSDGFNAPPQPDGSRRPGAWIAHYIRAVHPRGGQGGLDYAIITHFHADHMGLVTGESPLSADGSYRLSGITEVAETFPIATLLDRGWPDYAFPAPLLDPVMKNYRAFVQWQREHRQMAVERLEAGRNDQIVLRRAPEKYPDFVVRNIAVNGRIWTGTGGQARNRFHPDDPPTENNCSFAFTLRYGPFTYFNGGDMKGLPDPSITALQDMESAVAWVVGPVDVYTLNHHGSPDSANPFILSVLQPRVNVIAVWAAAHPGPDVMRRLISPSSYPGPRDIFLTNGIWAGRHASMTSRFGAANADWLAKQIEAAASPQGHVVVRVAPGGDEYRVLVVDDSKEDGLVRSVHGPYPSRDAAARRRAPQPETSN